MIHIHGSWIFLFHHVDDFFVAAPAAALTTQMFALIDDHLNIPLKCLGLVTLFNHMSTDTTLYQNNMQILPQTHL